MSRISAPRPTKKPDGTPAANAVARREGISESGYRCAFNVGADAGQTIFHIHLHVLGGRELGREG